MVGKAQALLKHNHNKGKIILSTVSGIVTTEPGMVSFFDENVPSADIITTKSYQVVRTFGHREPVIASAGEGSFANFVGLRNPGMDAVFSSYEKMYKKGMRAVLNISLSANSIENFITLVNKFSPVADMVELNFSCPHAAAGFGASIGSDVATAKMYVENIVKARKDGHALLIIKLTPNVSNIERIAKAVIDAGADGVAAVNTVGPYDIKEKISGQSIFSTAEGGRGGVSGERIKDIALDAVRRIRREIGDEPIILGMGGITDAEDAARMIKAGADAAGIGSALSRVEFEDIPKYFDALKKGRDVRKIVSSQDRLQYVPHKVIKTETVGKDQLLLELDGSLDCRPGQFCFLWIPQKGEKPFSVAVNRPLTFLIKRRGQFTEECFKLKKGDTVYTRGLYGRPMNIRKTEKALLVAGGSGVAVMPLLAEELKKNGTKMTFKVGVVNRDRSGEAFEKLLSSYGRAEYIADDGKPGRVMDTISADDVKGDTAVYIVGPEIMMQKCAEHLSELGISDEKINMSMEKFTLCGIGMCGECVCAGRLACKTGTFYTYDELKADEDD